MDDDYYGNQLKREFPLQSDEEISNLLIDPYYHDYYNHDPYNSFP